MIDQNPSNITDICEIGRGIFGVSHIITKSNNQFFVMKKLDKNVKIRENCINKFIGKPNYPAIAKYIKYFKKIKKDDNILLITDFYTKGSLFDFISLNKTNSKDFTFFTIEEEFTLSYFISKGLDYLHSNQIVHGNLTSKNILIDKNSHPHLDGFIYTRDIDSDDDTEKMDFVINYTAPEILKDITESGKFEPTQKSDIYSFGMILYEILTGQTPFQEFDSPDLLREKIIFGLRPPTDSIFDPFIPIIERCWDPDPDKRPTANEISSKIYEIAKSLSILRWYNSYGQDLKDISNTETIFDGFWKPLCKAGERNESHVSMFIIGIMCLNGSVQNLTEEGNIGLKFVLVSSDSYEYAMKKVIELRENGNIGDIEGFNVDEMKDIVEHFESRFANNMAPIHYNLSIK